ncbi:MAG: protein BatD [Verrucomicrobia bacterium]|nr:protein BatD [Verrucomicrobiota bacterium]
MVLLLYCVVAPAAALTFTARLLPDTIRQGDTATLRLEFSGGSPKALPSIPAVPNLTFAFAGQSTEWSMVNGQQSSKMIYLFRVIPAQPGDYTIPAITPLVEGPPQTSPPMKFKVLPGTAPLPAAPQADLDKLAFFRLFVETNEVYVGQVFGVEMKLYFIAGQDVQLPNLRCDGFIANKTVNAQGREQVGDTIYNVISFRTVAVPVKAGRLAFGPGECNITIRIPTAAPSNPFQPPYSLKQVSPKSDPVVMNVLPLPRENVPPGFSGAVGNYSLAMTAGPTNLMVGDPITIKVQIAGSGAIDSVMLPAMEAWREFKAYPINSKSEAADPLARSGVKTFEQILIPQNAEIKKLPGVTFSFFDPQVKQYRVLTQPDVPLLVRPSDAAAQQPTVLTNITANTPSAPPPAKDIAHIKPRPGLLADIQPPLIRQTWFQVVQTLPAFVCLALFIRRKRQEHLENNPRLRRAREVGAFVENGLRQLHAHAGANEDEKFFELIFHLLQARLGERLDLPASAITQSVIDEHLRPVGWTEEKLVPLREMFQTCDQARFAPQRTSQELAALIPKVEAILQQLGGEPGRN